MKLYGTTTSPFVRRVRIVAAEVGQPIEMINTATDAGQAALREITPIRKVPVAVVNDTALDDTTLFDSRVIIEWMTRKHGWGEMLPPHDPWRDHNLINAIDAALDAAIQLFYLRRDGIAIDGTPYATRQLDRADAIFAWLGKELAPDHRTLTGGLGVPEISLVCALDWMDFRTTYPTERVGALEDIRSAWKDRASFAATRPHA